MHLIVYGGRSQVGASLRSRIRTLSSGRDEILGMCGVFGAVVGAIFFGILATVAQIGVQVPGTAGGEEAGGVFGGVGGVLVGEIRLLSVNCCASPTKRWASSRAKAP